MKGGKGSGGGRKHRSPMGCQIGIEGRWNRGGGWVDCVTGVENEIISKVNGRGKEWLGGGGLGGSKGDRSAMH